MRWYVYKILKNEVDEGFALIQKEIKQTLEDIMVSIIETENPKFSKMTVDVVLEKRLKGKVSVTVTESILKSMYPNNTQKQDDLLSEVLIDNKINVQTKR